jgi:hypothetical protein
MAVKISRIVGDEPSSWLEGIPCTELAGGRKASLDSIGLRDAISKVGRGLPFLRNPTDMVEKDNYQVALIPLPNPAKHSGSDVPVLAKMNSILVLPMTWKDLVTRLRGEGKRSRSNRESDVVGFGAVCVNLSRMEVSRAGEPVAFTPLEFRLLRYFIWNPARVISRDELLNEVWGFDNYPCTRTVDSHVWRLRKKLEADPASPVHFHTVHAVGYKFFP